MGTRALIILTLLIGARAYGSACCGAAGAGLSSMILGDFKSVYNFSYTNSGVTHDATASGDIFKRSGETKEVFEGIVFSGAHLVSSYWQLGVAIPLRLNTFNTSTTSENSIGMGDISAQVTYEFLPELSYSFWKPKGYLYFSQTLPTGGSVYSAKKPLATDAFGRGFYRSAAGVVFVKIISEFDFLGSFEGSYEFKRVFNSNDLSSSSISITPGLGASTLISLGYSPSNTNFRIGSSISYRYRSGREIEIQKETSHAISMGLLNFGLNLSYIHKLNSINFSYSDDSFFGTAKNMALAKTIGLSVSQFIDL